MTPADLPPPAPISAEVQPWHEVLNQPQRDYGWWTDASVPFEEKLNRCEQHILSLPQVDCPLVHTYPDGLYMREIFMPAGSVITSRTHLFDNPFFIMSGKVSVVSENEGVVDYVAPFHGITKAGTRRLLLIHEDTVWITVHANPENKTDDKVLLEELSFVANPYILTEGTV